MEGCWGLVWGEQAAWSRPQRCMGAVSILSAAHRHGASHEHHEAPELSAQKGWHRADAVRRTW